MKLLIPPQEACPEYIITSGLTGKWDGVDHCESIENGDIVLKIFTFYRQKYGDFMEVSIEIDSKANLHIKFITSSTPDTLYIYPDIEGNTYFVSD